MKTMWWFLLAGASLVAEADTRTLSCEERDVVEKQLTTVDSALDPVERLRAASELASVERRGRAAYPHLSAEEWKQVQSAARAWEQVKASVERFEAHLSSDALEAATAGEVGALARSVQRLFLASTASCTAEDFKKLEKTVGLGRLAVLAPPVTQIAYYRERGHDRSRALALAEYLKGEEEEEPGATELSAFYRLFAETAEDSENTPDQRKWEQAERDKVRANRVKAEEIDRVVAELVRVAPGCFLGAAREREEHEARALTMVRGERHLEQLEYLLRRGERPTDTEDFLTPEDASPLDHRLDGWIKDYRIRYDGKQATLYSFGPDGKNATDDDIVIGSVLLPPKR